MISAPPRNGRTRWGSPDSAKAWPRDAEKTKRHDSTRTTRPVDQCRIEIAFFRRAVREAFCGLADEFIFDVAFSPACFLACFLACSLPCARASRGPRSGDGLPRS